MTNLKLSILMKKVFKRLLVMESELLLNAENSMRSWLVHLRFIHEFHTSLRVRMWRSSATTAAWSRSSFPFIPSASSWPRSQRRGCSTPPSKTSRGQRSRTSSSIPPSCTARWSGKRSWGVRNGTSRCWEVSFGSTGLTLTSHSSVTPESAACVLQACQCSTGSPEGCLCGEPFPLTWPSSSTSSSPSSILTTPDKVLKIFSAATNKQQNRAAALCFNYLTQNDKAFFVFWIMIWVYNLNCYHHYYYIII